MVQIVIGTQKGGFVLDPARARIEGPFFKGWKVTTATSSGGRVFVATASDVYGAAVHEGPSLSELRQIEHGPAYAKDSKHKLNQVWRLVARGETLWAGVDEAGIFRRDEGGPFEPVAALNDHSSRSRWQPGFGGLCAHALLFDEERIWCGISAVGLFRSDDGGRTFAPRNDGVPAMLEDEVEKGIGRCPHALVQDPGNPELIWRQDHAGMFRTRDGGDSWERIESGLPSRFGFPLALHAKTRTLFAFPLESDEHRMPPGGRFAVYRSRDEGSSWEPAGKPLEGFHAGVLRGAIACDDEGRVYVGSTAGTLHVGENLGESWRAVAGTLPRILSVSVIAS